LSRHAAVLAASIAFALTCRHETPARPGESPATASAASSSGAADSNSAPVDAGSDSAARDAHDATAQDPRLLALADQIATEVSHLRGLALRRPIERGVLDREQILNRLRARVAHEYPPGEIVLEGEMEKRLGFLPEDLDYEQTVFDLLEEQVAGFYDPDDGQLFIASWVPQLMQTPTMAHEITHALQDQHFDLSRFTHHVRGRGDAQSAAMAIVEGDATVVMLEHMMRPLGRSVRDIPDPDAMFRSQVMQVTGQSRLAAAPRALRETLLFPYRYGFAVCARQYTARDFGAVDDLLRTPPESTEQILHAEKLAAREPPIAIPATLPAALASDHVLLADDVMGEFGLLLFLERGVDDATSERGAAGWGGDRAILFAPRASGITVGSGDAGTQLPAGATRQIGLAWTIVFDRAAGHADDAEAREFESGAIAVLSARYPHAAARIVPGASRALETEPGHMAVVARAGRSVLVLDRAPADRVDAMVLSMLADANRLAGASAPTSAPAPRAGRRR
jgi:hypothetical protein